MVSSIFVGFVNTVDNCVLRLCEHTISTVWGGVDALYIN